MSFTQIYATIIAKINNIIIITIIEIPNINWKSISFSALISNNISIINILKNEYDIRKEDTIIELDKISIFPSSIILTKQFNKTKL